MLSIDRITIPMDSLKKIGMRYGYLVCDVCGNEFKPRFYDRKGEITLKPQYIHENSSMRKFFLCCNRNCKENGKFSIQRRDITMIKRMRDIDWK